MDSETARRLTDFAMMVGLLRRDIKNNKEHADWDRYEGRFARIEQKFSSLAELISRDDPELAKALHTAFQQPSRALAFKNAEHQKELKKKAQSEDNASED